MGRLRRYALTLSAVIAVTAATAATAQAQHLRQSIDLRVEAGSEFGRFRIVNRGAGLRLNATVTVEQAQHGAWTPTAVGNLYLTTACAASPVPKCITLERRGSLQPVPWRGNYCDAQCPANCDLDGVVAPGKYRFAVTTCDGKHKFVSPAFEKTR